MRSTALSDYRGEMIESATLAGDNEPWWCAEVDPEEPSRVTIVWTEGFAWHAESHNAGLADDDGWPRENVAGILETELRRLLARYDVWVQVSDQDEPALQVSVALTVDPATVERLGELAWPVVATLTNVFDPGTFGAEYVMGNVARTLTATA